MAKSANIDALAAIDEALVHEAPEFMDSLADLDPKLMTANKAMMDSIDGKEQDEGPPSFRVQMRGGWGALTPRNKQVVFSFVFLLFVGGPMTYLAYVGAFTPNYSFSEISSLKKVGDQVISFDSKAKTKDVLRLFQRREVIFMVPEQLITIKPLDGVTYLRLVIAMQLNDEKKLSVIRKKEAEILDVLNEELQPLTYKDFSGLTGKRRIRQKIISSLQERVSDSINNIYYHLMVFNE